MTETRSATTSDSLVSLSARYSGLISRQQTMVERIQNQTAAIQNQTAAIQRQTEETARNSAALERMIEMLEQLQLPRADKQTTEAQAPPDIVVVESTPESVESAAVEVTESFEDVESEMTTENILESEVDEAADSGDDGYDLDVHLHLDPKISAVIDFTLQEVTLNRLPVVNQTVSVTKTDQYDAEISEENFETKFCVSNTVSDVCLLPVCENAAVYLSSIPLAHKTFNGNWCSMQVFYIAAVYLKPPWEPPDGEFKFMSLPMSENYEIENINEEGLRIVWREAETKKRVTIAIESLLKIDTDAEWDFVDHSSTLRHGNDGVILLVWFEKPPPLPPEIERGLQGRFTWTKKKHDSELVKRHSEFINYSISPWIKHCFMELELYKVGGTHDGKKLESLPLKIEKVKNLQNSDLSQSWFKGFMVRVVLQCKGLEILNLSRYNFAESYPYGFESSLGVRVLEKLDVFYDQYNGLITCTLGDLSHLQDGSVLGELSSTRRLSVINIATVVSDIIIRTTNAVGTGLSFHVEKIGEHADKAIKPKKISFLFLEVWGQINSLRVTFSNWKEVRSKTMMKKFQYYDEVVGRVFERLSTSIDTYFRGDYSGKTMVDWLSDEFKRNDDMYLPMDKQPSHQITDVDEKINGELPPTAHGPVNAATFWTTSQPSLGSFGITCIKDYVEINFIGYLEPTIDDVGFICLFAPFSEILVTRDAAMLHLGCLEAVFYSFELDEDCIGILSDPSMFILLYLTKFARVRITEWATCYAKNQPLRDLIFLLLFYTTTHDWQNSNLVFLIGSFLLVHLVSVKHLHANLLDWYETGKAEECVLQWRILELNYENKVTEGSCGDAYLIYIGLDEEICWMMISAELAMAILKNDESKDEKKQEELMTRIKGLCKDINEVQVEDNFLWFSLPRPPDIADLEGKVNFKGRGMLRTQYYLNKGV